MQLRRRSELAALMLAVLLCACGGGRTPGLDSLETGREVYGSLCSSCHGSAGEGGVGAALDDVMATFPSCSNHIKWVTLGTARWTEELGSTYGANDKEVTGVMPEFGIGLSVEAIVEVAIFERVRYGGGDEATVRADCGG